MMHATTRGLVLFALVPALVRAQAPAPPSGRCAFNVKGERQGRLIRLPSGQSNAFVGGNVVATCRAQGIVLKSDSLESYGDEGRIVFIGHVDYAEPRMKLKSDLLTYFQREERFLAIQNVDARLPSGTTIKGPQLEYFRAVPRMRPQQSATAPGRPTITLVERDAQGKPQPPVRVTGNIVWLKGDSVVSSAGEVVVVRPELTATGDSLYADAGAGLLRIMRKPKITGTKGRPFTLVGETIDLLTRQRKLERVLAKNGGQAQSEDLALTADSIDMRVANDQLQRAIAWGKSRAHATSHTQSIIADSIDVLMPGQQVREMHAVRKASAEADPDTVKFRTKEKDRITGDTIVAWFDSVPARDTSARQRMRELLATGLPTAPATSLQHVPPSDTSLCVPKINYVRGRSIRVTFVAGKIDSVKVTDPDVAGGVIVDPTADSTSRCVRPAAATAATPAVPAAARAGVAPGQAPAGSPPQPPTTPPASLPSAPAPTPKRP